MTRLLAVLSDERISRRARIALALRVPEAVLRTIAQRLPAWLLRRLADRERGRAPVGPWIPLLAKLEEHGTMEDRYLVEFAERPLGGPERWLLENGREGAAGEAAANGWVLCALWSPAPGRQELRAFPTQAALDEFNALPVVTSPAWWRVRYGTLRPLVARELPTIEDVRASAP